MFVARALLSAAKLLEESPLQKKCWPTVMLFLDSGKGKEFEEGKLSLKTS